MNPEFWRGKKVLVTGHTGFKGGWLSLWLQQLGAQVIGYALAPNTDPSMFEAAEVADGMTSIIGDLRDLSKLTRTLEEHAPEIVIHMGAQAILSVAYQDPVLTYTSNTIGSMNLLEAIRCTNSVRVAVMITTDKCYENVEWVWGYRENDRLGGHDPYSSSKAAAELIIRAYRESFFPDSQFDAHRVAIASARAGNVIGGGDWSPDRLIPDLMRTMLDGRLTTIRRPTATRPWQFVLEPLNGYLVLAEQLWRRGSAVTEAWNFGPSVDELYDVAWISNYIADKTGGRWDTPEGAVDLTESRLLKLDCTKARMRLGWAPKLDLPTCLDWVLEWYRAHNEGQDVRSVCHLQIERFQSIE
ncbi:CDP-glucose 4,6-dehydratase [Halochromatium glycolicum]|uniref:CDP-glucose 4,6-dehydratase n=1 Tax=Halochromatium glycolicum TaxID=85075 RepID=A0AAJ0U0P4_9GAMM|nr:CDP-glucose 4,6-dehydratase [Halochromatium glycolicum]